VGRPAAHGTDPLAAPFLEQACGIPAGTGQVNQGDNLHAVGERVVTFTGINHDTSIQLQIVEGTTHRGRQDGRVRAFAFNPDAPAVLEQDQVDLGTLVRGAAAMNWGANVVLPH